MPVQAPSAEPEATAEGPTPAPGAAQTRAAAGAARRPSLRAILQVLAVALLGVGVGALAVLGVRGSSGASGDAVTAGAERPPAALADDARLTAVRAYLAELKPLTEEAGFVVERGLKAGVVDIAESNYDDETLRQMPAGWGEELTDVRERLGAVQPPRALREAHGYFLDALDGYVTVSRRLSEAAAAQPSERPEIAERAGDLGARTDQIWNAGAVIVQDHLRAHGAQPVYWLPDPEHDGRTELEDL